MARPRRRLLFFAGLALLALLALSLGVVRAQVRRKGKNDGVFLFSSSLLYHRSIVVDRLLPFRSDAAGALSLSLSLFSFLSESRARLDLTTTNTQKSKPKQDSGEVSKLKVCR